MNDQPPDVKKQRTPVQLFGQLHLVVATVNENDPAQGPKSYAFWAKHARLGKPALLLGTNFMRAWSEAAYHATSDFPDLHVVSCWRVSHNRAKLLVGIVVNLTQEQIALVPHEMMAYDELRDIAAEQRVKVSEVYGRYHA